MSEPTNPPPRPAVARSRTIISTTRWHLIWHWRAALPGWNLRLHGIYTWAVWVGPLELRRWRDYAGGY